MGPELKWHLLGSQLITDEVKARSIDTQWVKCCGGRERAFLQWAESFPQLNLFNLSLSFHFSSFLIFSDHSNLQTSLSSIKP